MKSILLASIVALLAGVILVGRGRISSGGPEQDRAGAAPVTTTPSADPCHVLPMEHVAGSHSEMDQENGLITKNIIISLL
jgi:hypothetical protein